MFDPPSFTLYGGDMIKDVLVHVDGTRSGQRRLAYAPGMAGRHGAYLTAAHVMLPADVPTVFKPNLIGRATEAQEERDAADAQHAKQYFDHIAPARGVNANWIDLTGYLAPQLSKTARYSDLVIVGQYEWQISVEWYPLSLAESLVLACGRPAAPAHALATRLNDGHFDLLAMDAYGRPAWLEFLFGGTTPSTLLQATVPILMSH